MVIWRSQEAFTNCRWSGLAFCTLGVALSHQVMSGEGSCLWASHRGI